MSYVPSPMCTARFLKTILAPSNWQGYQNFALGPSTLTYATIIFVNMYARDSSRSSLWTPRTRLLTHSPNPWHKMTFNVIVASCAASNLTSNQSEGVLCIRVLWYLFRVRTYLENIFRHSDECAIDCYVCFSIMSARTKRVSSITSKVLFQA